MTNLVIDSVNVAADRWAAWMVAASLDAAALFALVGSVWLVIRTRVAPQVGYCLFLLVPLKLLMPLDITVPVTVARWTPSALASSWYQQGRRDGTAAPPSFATAMPTRSVMSGTRATLPPIERPSVMACPAPVHRPADSTNQVPRPSLAAIIMLGWFICVLSLLVRLARTQLRLHAHLQHLSALDETRLGIDLRELCRLASIRQTVRIVECDGIGAPSVWGIARPMIVLPRGIAMALTAQQLRWALLHELAHIRRFDLVVVGLQRCAAILHFINPVVWATNRIIHRLREYACDDLAVSIGQTTGVESGEAFLRILRRRSRPPDTRRSARHFRSGLASLVFLAGSPLAGHRKTDPVRAGRVVALGSGLPRSRIAATPARRP